MAQRNLRQKPRISYYEPEEPALDEYVFCEKCGDSVYEYCSIHGPLLVIPDNKVPAKPNVPSYVPRAALTIPNVFLHITHSIIPDAGLGVFSSLTLPCGVRFGPYRGQRTDAVHSNYCWQIYDNNRKPVHCVDAADADKSNWMRYVNCARHWREQNLVAYQYRGELYYRTIKIIPRFTELMVFYGSEFACELDVDLGKYNSPVGYAQKFGALVTQKIITIENNTKGNEEFETSNVSQKSGTNNVPTTDLANETVVEQVVTPNLEQGTVSGHDVKPNTITKKRKCVKTVKLSSVSKTKHTNVEEKRKSKINNINKSAHDTTVITPIILSQENINNGNSLSLDGKTCIEPNTITVLDLYVYCNYCNKKCISKQELQRHLRFHDSNRAYTCPVCKKTFIQNGDWKQHMRIHTGEKPYTCEICNKAFNANSNWKQHMRIHTGEKPYTCEICNKAFNANSSWKYHMRIHTGEKPYTCEICNKTFIQNGDWKQHMRIHTGEKPYTCEICNKAFNANSNWKQHMRIHTGEKPYTCEICNKAFNANSSWKCHMRIHTGEKPFACEICNKKFSTKHWLKNHLIKLHLK